MPSGAERRAARFAKAQAALPEEKRLENRTDLELPCQKRLSVVTESEYYRAKKWFLEYIQLEHPHINGELFFQRDSPPPTPAFLKAYAVFVAQSHIGQIGDKLSAWSLGHYIKDTIIILNRERRCRFLTPEQAEDVRSYVKYHLPEEENLSKKKYKKGVAHSEDMTFLLSVLFTPSYLGTFMDMRTVLNTVLYMNLVVDSCGRGGDIAQNPSQKPGRHLKWGDVKFYAFPLADGVEIQALVTFNWMKGRSITNPNTKRSHTC